MMTNKTGQVLSIPIPTNQDLPMQAIPVDGQGNPDEMFVVTDEPNEEAQLNVENNDIVFVINTVPGAPADLVVEEPDEDHKEEEVLPEVVIPEENSDVWNWEKSHGVPKFLNWLKQMIDGVPAHSGSDTTGVERAIAYFDRLNGEISKAMRKDYNREVDAAKAEEARSMIEDGLKRLVDRLEQLREKKFKKSKKKAGLEAGVITKMAETSFTGGMQVNVPYFISFVARTCIDASVQGGKDMRETFVKLSSEYKLDKREKVQVIQLIKDMGYPLVLDRIRINEGKLDMSDKDGEFLAQYKA